jgi:hypothetical protein
MGFISIRSPFFSFLCPLLSLATYPCLLPLAWLSPFPSPFPSLPLSLHPSFSAALAYATLTVIQLANKTVWRCLCLSPYSSIFSICPSRTTASVLQRELTSEKQQEMVIVVMEVASCLRHTRVTIRRPDTDKIDWRRETDDSAAPF